MDRIEVERKVEVLAELLGMDDLEFEIYKDYQDNGFMDGDRLMAVTKAEAERRRAGSPPITGAMIRRGAARAS